MNNFLDKGHNYDDRIQCRTHERGLAFPQDPWYGLDVSHKMLALKSKQVARCGEIVIC